MDTALDDKHEVDALRTQYTMSVATLLDEVELETRRIFAKTKHGETFTSDGLTRDSAVEKVKIKLQDKKGRLTRAGKTQDNGLLSDHGIQPGTTIYESGHLRGGVVKGAKVKQGKASKHRSTVVRTAASVQQTVMSTVPGTSELESEMQQ